MENSVLTYFINRSPKYNASSAWVTDKMFIQKIYQLSEPNENSTVLDVAAGTGLIAKQFHGNVKKIVCVDICESMVQQAKDQLDTLIISKIENISLPDNSFDICVCRQGLQFAELDETLKQIYRILKPGGVTVLAHLTSYPEETEEDKKITFKIQALREPVRKNYLSYDTIQKMLQTAGFKDIEIHPYITKESINRWINHGAISEENKTAIIQCYHMAPSHYKEIHHIEIFDNDIFDDMHMTIVKAKKPQY